MIFVVLGTQKFQLNRLLKEIDKGIEKGAITDEVFAQIGHSDYQPKYFNYEKFLDKKIFDEYIAKSDLLISHSGVGTIITGLQSQRPVIVYPRLAKFHEHVDDHQLDIARAFEKKNYVMCCYEKDKLEDKISECRKHTFEKYQSQTQHIISVIQNFLEQLEA